MMRLKIWRLSFFISSCFMISTAFGQRPIARSNGICELIVAPYETYNCQEFVVETQDGFLLGLQRVSSKLSAFPPKKGPVFLLHGFLVGGDVWFLSLPSEALGFILADAGYDVWNGNTRTTRFSAGHVSYTSKDRGFWDWSVDELAEMDLPAMLQFIRTETSKKIQYIGYSQGAQQAFAALSEGLIGDLVDKMVMLAPVAFATYTTAPAEVAIATLELDKVFEAARIYEFSTVTQMGRQIVDLICAPSNMRCYKDWTYFLSGENCCLNLTRRPYVDQYETQPTSTKNLAHFAQQRRKKNFAKFDYGFFGNLQRYHRPWPASYNLQKVPTEKLYMLYGQLDGLANVKDVNRLISELQGSFPLTLVPKFGHLDFILGVNAKPQVYDKLIAFLES